jgi:hypothetical protein
MEIKGDNYSVSYDENDTSIFCKGSFRLRGADEYDPIIKLLNDVAAAEPAQIILDLRELEFLNSSGINMLSKFVINVRKKGASDLTVKGSQSYPWQSKSLKNLQRLMPNLVLEIY